MNKLFFSAKFLCNVILIFYVSTPILWALELPQNITINKDELLTTNNAKLPANLGIQGYSPVSYFENNKAEMGVSKFQTEYNNKVYWFTSADQINTFKSNPEKFLPTFEAFCPYALSLGRKVGIDPTNFKIVAGQLLLFHRTSEVDALKAFNQSANQDEILRRAKENYLSLDF